MPALELDSPSVTRYMVIVQVRYKGRGSAFRIEWQDIVSNRRSSVPTYRRNGGGKSFFMPRDRIDKTANIICFPPWEIAAVSSAYVQEDVRAEYLTCQPGSVVQEIRVRAGGEQAESHYDCAFQTNHSEQGYQIRVLSRQSLKLRPKTMSESRPGFP
jgi:hypothetical protein